MIYAYARISKDNDKSVAVEDQIRKIRAFADATDRIIDNVFVDRDASGRSLARPQLKELLQVLQPGDTVIVHKLDRLTRSVRDLGYLLDRKFNIVSVTESLDTNSASGRLIVNILATVSQWEREVIAERTTASLAFKRERRSVYGAVPYGYRREGSELVKDENEQCVLGLIRLWFRQGHSYHQMSQALNERHRDACRGKKWYRATVRGILTSKMEVTAGANGQSEALQAVC